METTQTVPYKIGKVSFVPSGGLAAISKEVLTVSDMNSNNCIQIFQFDQNKIERTWSSQIESKVTDVQWVRDKVFLAKIPFLTLTDILDGRKCATKE